MDSKWKQYEAELTSLKDIAIPRRVITLDKPTALELHGFSDASELAYGACIYLRSTNDDGTHSTQLLCSKNRVAPLKSLSIPRLELCAALLLARLVNKVTKGLVHDVKSIYLWTDSTIVLAWLQSCSRTWTPFVANRVGEIQHLTTTRDWHHVSSQDNPADVLSRGVMPSSLRLTSLWWSGPLWLGLNKEGCPRFPDIVDESQLPERKATAVAALTITESSFDIFERFLKFTKLLRVVSYIYRFYNQLKRRTKISKDTPSHLTNERHQSILPIELEYAEQVLVKMVQNSNFSTELELLSSQRNLPRHSPVLSLNPFIDQAGILRVGGRLKLSQLPYNAKYPMLLPGRHPLSALIIKHEHERHLHAGPQATLSVIRQRYWLVSARDAVRRITRKCVICFRSSPRSASTLMGNLPKSRVTVPARAFEKCGVDYAGPFYYKDGARRSAKLLKCYMAIFVCFATTAVHIELAADLSAEAFLNVLKRFISRRGYPTDIFSDNGLNFIGAEHELQDLAALLNTQETQRKIIDSMAANRINWHFIPPRAPHHGVLWEAAVKIAK
ncbi:PREDICTED: uncharacterized protein LOC105566505, partial [Vollenhovia emeryi]|uniref:uncharacterized protein LOC105566505 n=1 Tax=Vollenhovia emeryi TaxID=411798 RepID=UPI0005F37199